MHNLLQYQKQKGRREYRIASLIKEIEPDLCLHVSEAILHWQLIGDDAVVELHHNVDRG